MIDLPTTTVTFLMTDVEGSTRLWQEAPEQMREALTRHDELVAGLVAQHRGLLIKSRGEGDSHFAVFPAAADAVAAAAALQRAIASEPWPARAPLRVRIALHTGDGVLGEADFYGTPVNRCARLRATAHGGQVVLSAATQELVRESLSESISLRDLGTHRLRDLLAPERVFQLVVPDLRSEFPPLRALDEGNTNLPLQLTSFIGREREMAEVKRLLGTTRLLTLTGTGGTGKTRLSLQAAADLVEDYEDGVWLVELAPIADPELVPHAVAAVLETHEEAGRSLMERLVERLRGRQLLLLLDNCEQVLDACAELAAVLTQRCPQVSILASSREALNVPGELTYRLPSLSVPDPKRLAAEPPETLARYEAVMLFNDRAVRALPSFRLTAGNAVAVAQICSRLDGIPLALELAAARLRALPLDRLAERLDDRFRLLTGGSRTVLPRQQTLKALIDWSYELLSDSERALLRRLSVFSGGWTLEAAETVCNDGDRRMKDEGCEPQDLHPSSFILLPSEHILDLLTSLVDKSLVVFEEDGEGSRYRLLETIRQYARDRLLEAGEADAARQRHFDYFLALAREASAGLNGPGLAGSLRALDEEHENLRAALDWSADRAESQLSHLSLALAVAPFWELRGYLHEGMDRLTTAVGAAEEAGPERAEALYWLGSFDGYRDGFDGYCGDQAGQRRRMEESLAICRVIQDPRGMANALKKLSRLARDQGEYARAWALAQEGLSLSQQARDGPGVAAALQELGLVLHATGSDAGARSLLEQSVALVRRLGDQRAITVGLANLAMVLAALDELPQARELQEETLEILRGFGNKIRLGVALVNFAATVARQGDTERARALNEEALPLFEREGHVGFTALVCLNLGDFALRDRRFADARALYSRSLRLFQQAGEKPRIVDLLDHFADLEWNMGLPDRTVALQAAANRFRKDLGISPSADVSEDREAREALIDVDGASAARGASMTLDEAISYALAADARSRGRD